MKVYETKDIRNVGVVGHGDSGKTTLTAGLLFTSGATNRLLRVDEGNTITDFDDEEIARKITISTAIAAAEWKKTKINILDTPGYNIFINDTRAALVAADSALVMVDGVAGVEVQTEKVWSFANDFKLHRAIVSNKLDRERADFERALTTVQENFGRAAVPVQIPIGAERDFKGVVDLVRMKAYTYTPDGDGKGKESEIPANLEDAAQKAHEALIEMVAEGNDALMEQFFEHGHAGNRSDCHRLETGGCGNADFPGLLRLQLAQCRHRSDSQLHCGESARAHRTRGHAGHYRRQGGDAKSLPYRRRVGLRLQDHGRPVFGAHHFLQSDHRDSEKRRQSDQCYARHH